MKEAAAYFLLLTSMTWISVINSTCYCSNETSLDIYEPKNCPYPSIFASEASAISVPLLTLDELVQHFTAEDGGNAQYHPFEDLWEFIHFVDGSSVNVRGFIFDAAPFISSAVEYVENSSFSDSPIISGIKDKLPNVSEMKERVTPIVDAVEEKVSPYVSAIKDEIVSPILASVEEKVAPIIADSYKYGLEYVKNNNGHVSRVQRNIAPVINDLKGKADTVMDAAKETIAPIYDSVKDQIQSALNNADVQESIAPFIDTVEDKAASVMDAAKEKVAPIIDSLKSAISNAEDRIPDVSHVQENVAPIIDDLEDKAATVMDAAKEKVSSIISNVEEHVMPQEKKLTPEVSDSESSADMAIPDEDDFGDYSEVEQEESDAGAASEIDESKKARFYRMLRSLLAMSIIGLLSLVYLFILSIIVYVFLKDYFDTKYDAESNEHFRELLRKIQNEHKLSRPRGIIALPAPPPKKKDQEQQTDDEDDNGGEDDFPPIDEEDGCSSEADVSMRDDDATSSRA